MYAYISMAEEMKTFPYISIERNGLVNSTTSAKMIKLYYCALSFYIVRVTGFSTLKDNRNNPLLL